MLRSELFVTGESFTLAKRASVLAVIVMSDFSLPVKVTESKSCYISV